ncbi:MAG: hypothetical protein AAF809_06260 [Bacteroidota bacterium]
MRLAFATLLLALLLATTPVQAQFRADAPNGPAPVMVTANPAGASLGRFFSGDAFKLSHSYEVSYSSFGSAGGFGMGLYTTSLRWQPTANLAGRVDVGVAHAPFGSSQLQSAFGFSENQPAQVFIRNAELAYRPTENSMIRLQFSQNPFGNAGGLYGAQGLGYGYSPYFGGSSFRAGYGSSDYDTLFWRN